MRFLSAAGSLLVLVFATGNVAAQSAPGSTSDCSCCRGTTCSRSGNWLIRETENFRLYTPVGQSGVTHLAGTCEALRKQLQRTWLGDEKAAWSSKCDIVLHATVAPYRRELGPGSEQSSGCATLDINGERVTRRRIDVRADAADWLTAALPHELTHVILADRFARVRIPRWADEGIAILSEPRSKQLHRQREMDASLARGNSYSAAELVGVKDYPDAARRDAFYGQSAALVAHLVEKDSPAAFVEFLALALDRDYSTALREKYGAASLASLQVPWRIVRGAGGEDAQLIAGEVGKIVSAVE